jgi:riboflavin kinase / FMN adenylyltransferase
MTQSSKRTPLLQLTDVASLPDLGRGGVVAIGNFDGVHLGHRGVLDSALAIAKKRRIPALALTFEPHPRTYFLPDRPVFRLTPGPMKARLLAGLGFDFVIEQTFDSAFAATKAGDFIDILLAGQLEAAHVVTGQDFHFGRNRKGTPDFLRENATRHGIEVSQVAPVLDPSGEIISSTRIRDALADGAIERANALLGRPWSVAGEVISGQKLGRELGFPTANLELPPQTRLRQGIYAVQIGGIGPGLPGGVASFGRRPTFDNGAVLLETFVFDFDGDLYGKEIEIIFHAFLRREEKFENAGALVGQMHRDAQRARAELAARTR